MRLSEAILLGSTVVKPLRGVGLTTKGEGCAIGMALKAAGAPMIPWYAVNPEILGLSDQDYRRFWPWKDKLCGIDLPCTCEAQELMCGRGDVVPRSSINTIHAIIVHLFNQHVIDGSWTIERLAEWVASVEPKEIAAGEEAAAELAVRD
jgi:hypothetical protein